MLKVLPNSYKYNNKNLSFKSQEKNKKRNNSLKNPTIATTGALGTLGIAILASNELKHRDILAPNIEFIEAKTIDEAKEFAKNNLKINKYDYEIDNLELANYINEALVTYNNNSKEHKKLISMIDMDDFPFGVCSIRNSKLFGGFLSFNKKHFENYQTQLEALSAKFENCNLEELYATYNFSEKQKNLLEKFINNPQDLSLKETIHAGTFLPLISPDGVDGMQYYCEILEDEKIFNYIKENNFPDTYDKFKALSLDEKIKTIENISTTFNYKVNIADAGEYSIIFHELGHILHEKKIGKKKFLDLMWHNTKSKEEDYLKCIERFLKTEKNACDIIAPTLGAYAVSSPLEFVAETFACLANGVKLNKEIMKVYKKYNGPMP